MSEILLASYPLSLELLWNYFPQVWFQFQELLLEESANLSCLLFVLKWLKPVQFEVKFVEL